MSDAAHTTSMFKRSDLSRAKIQLLRNGHFANAVVSRVDLDGESWTVKDFSSRPWYVRRFLAPWLLGHELSILRRLQGIDGVAQKAFRIDRDAIAVEFIDGSSLSRADKALISPAYLEALEELLRRIHAARVVHLDTRGTGNIMVREDGSPGLIDFQASLSTAWMPGWLRRILEDVDMSGVLKKWRKYRPEAMGAEREAELERIDRLRKFWIFRGYFGLRKRRRRRRAA